MVIIGLSCGHDASAAVIIDGEVVVNLERERFSRIKHVSGISPQLILSALEIAKLNISDIDLFAICTTQSIAFGTSDPKVMNFELSWETAEAIGVEKFDHDSFLRVCEEDKELKGRSEKYIDRTRNCETPNMPDFWRTQNGMDEIEKVDAKILKEKIFQRNIMSSFYTPCVTNFYGHKIRTVAIKHHLSHAAAAYFQSPYQSSMVLSYDNGAAQLTGRYTGGMVFFGDFNKLHAIWTFPTLAGKIYSSLAEVVGFDGFGGPGKLMGLSAYGEPLLFSNDFVNDGFKGSHQFNPRGEAGQRCWQIFDEFRRKKGMQAGRQERWANIIGLIGHVLEKSRELGVNAEAEPFSLFGKLVAASTQKIFEESVLSAYRKATKLFEKLEIEIDGLCLSGGAALNCPTNTILSKITPADGPFIPPSCDDGGLGIGAALFSYHHIYDKPRRSLGSLAENISFKGYSPPAKEYEDVIGVSNSDFSIARVQNLPDEISASLASGKIVGVFGGSAETGPRALGNRSILADPRDGSNWQRVNSIKQREQWRPFAPACLSEKLLDYFHEGPAKSPHMLFNYKVRSKDIPAVTHVDQTARVQTVEKGVGQLRQILNNFHEKTSMPVLLNTSLNGPGEPILNNAQHVLDFVRSSDIDVVYAGPFKVSKK